MPSPGKMDVEQALKEIEKEPDREGSTREFWRLVARVKKDPALREKYAPRIGRLDQEIFIRRVPFNLGIAPGNLLSLLGIAASVAVLLFHPYPQQPLAAPLVSALLLATAVHPLAHYLAGRLMGIGFTFYFLNGPIKIEPTIKTDYGTYLLASPEKRAMMHLSGALATTLSPLLILSLMRLLSIPAPAALLAALSLFFLGTELIPLGLLKLGSPRILGIDFTKSDTYRALREWSLRAPSP